MVKVIYVVRHAEREDNINRNWMQTKNPYNLTSDNSPLSLRGQKQADELNQRFCNEKIDLLFASPFDRTLETATRLIGNQNISIKVEPGLAEALYLCNSPPGFENLNVLKEKYSLIDEQYKPIFKKPLPKEGYGDDACVPRVKKTIETIINNYVDKDVAVLVSHGSPIAAIHEILCNNWTYVGQATVTKFNVDPKDSKKFYLEYSSDASHLSDKNNLRPF